MPLLRFFSSRLLSIAVTMLVVTMGLYGFVMLTPPEVRATLYYPSSINLDLMTDAEIQQLNERLIDRYRLADPYPLQYARWLANLVRGDWGWSPVHRQPVLAALLRRSPVTAELAFYSLLFFIPLGLIHGLRAGVGKDTKVDNYFRLAAFIAAALPPFVLAIILLAVFYVGLHWFPPQRLGIQSTLFVNSDAFHRFTGFLTIDGFLNQRPDLSLEALRHLFLPVLTVSLGYWALLGRVTRASVLEELHKEYILAARARGIPHRALVWKHLLRNILTPALTSSMLSAASLMTSLFIVEVIFDFKGVSSLVLDFSLPAPDAPLLLGFALYSVLVVLLLMFALDLLMLALDPRLRQGVLGE